MKSWPSSKCQSAGRERDGEAWRRPWAAALTLGLLVFVTPGGRAEMQSLTQARRIKSPDARLVATIGVTAQGQLAWQGWRQDRCVLETSPIGLRVNGQDLGLGVQIGKPQTRIVNETYPMRGAHVQATNHCRESVFPVTHTTSGIAYELVVRVYQDGIALRQRIPLSGTNHVEGESTGWTLPAEAQAWWSPLKSSYEEIYRSTAARELPDGQKLCPPVAFKLNDAGPILLITEADNTNFPDMALRREGTLLRPYYWACESGWRVGGTIATPWRVALIAADLNALVNSDLVANLCPPPAPELHAASWIQPGRALWEWYSSEAPVLAEQSDWIAAAVGLGWEYYLIDDGWRDWRSDGKDQWQCLAEVVAEAATRQVKCLVWVDSKEMQDAASRRAYLEKVKSVGAAGIKIDFIPPATAEIMRWYEDTLRDTAQLQLLCNFHGCVKPTGRQRTWPHELTREGVRGQEWHITRYPNRTMPPDTDTILPFTRFVAGPADYTPMVFDPEQLRGFTWARELAAAIVFTSPLMHYGDHYRQYVGGVLEDLLRELPTTWDETLVLPGTEPGRVVAFARRKGDVWWVGVMNGGSETRFEVKTTFLGRGRWAATWVQDVPERDAAVGRRARIVSSASGFPLLLRPGGGFVARLVPAPETTRPAR
jgi:alpha-glucosidase